MSRRSIAAATTLAAAVAGCWAGWMGWDRHRDVDPLTAATTGPYEPWQVVGCVLCLVGLAAVAPRWLPATIVVTVMAVVFTAAWSISATTGESVGANLWPLGALMVLAGTVAGSAVVAGLAYAAWRR